MSQEKTNLQELLQELVTHCRSVTGSDVELKLELPKPVYGEFCRIWRPIEKIKLSGDPTDPNVEITVRKLYLHGGTVEFIL
jgi:hypothetical protein